MNSNKNGAISMRAAVYYKRHDVRVEDVAVVPPGPDDVTVNLHYCGVCGTDLHIYNGDGGAGEVPPGTVIGHEMAGIVSQVGANVSKFAPGDRVSIDPNDPCGACYFCHNGQAHFCESMKGYGTSYNGGFAEYITVPGKQVFHIPDSLSLQAASQSETLSCCVHGIDLANIEVGQTVFVIGGGPIGQLMIQLASIAGASKVIVSEPVAEKRQKALALGATAVIDPMNDDIQAVLDRECYNVDRVIECVGSTVTMQQALQYAGKKCTVMLFGLTPPGAEMAIKPFQLFQRETTIVPSFINPYTFDRAIALLASGKLHMDEFITDIVPLEEINRVFEDDSFRKRGKILIEMPHK